MQSDHLPVLDGFIWMYNDNFSPAVCPICKKVINEECSLVPCEHALSLCLDIAGCTDNRPGWGYGGFHSDQADPVQDRFLLEEEWTLVRINQSDSPGPHGSTWGVELAWPTSELDPENPHASVQGAIHEAVDHCQELLESGLDPHDIPEHLMPPLRDRAGFTFTM